VRGVVRERPAPEGVEAVRADVRDAAAMREAAAGCEAVVHTAYVKDDRSVVVDGTAAVAAAAGGRRLVHVSSDLVFAGRDAPYTEADVPDPILPYGRWKARAEEAAAGGAIVRTSLVVGRPDGPQERLARTPGATFFTDEVRCPVDVDVLAAALLALATRVGHTGPLHVAGAPCTRFELAVRLGACEPRGAASPPGRPKVVVLDCSLARTLGVL
jgi:dTDP-4-dehydrorhamnose reductase